MLTIIEQQGLLRGRLELLLSSCRLQVKLPQSAVRQDNIKTILVNGKPSQNLCSIHYHRFRLHGILCAINERLYVRFRPRGHP